MCIPVVKSRWRVRHWSAPDRILSASSSGDPFNGNPNEAPIIEDLTTITGQQVEPSNMVRDPYLFSSDIEDHINEIASPMISFSKPFKGDDVLALSPTFFTHSFWDGLGRVGDNNAVRNDEGSENRSPATCSIDEIPTDAKENTEPSKEQFMFAQEQNKEELYSVRDAIPGTRQRHASCPSVLQDDRCDSSIDELCLAALSQPSLPAPSILIMLLLQRRQNLKEVSLASNTARRNLSTARTTTILQRPTIRAPRHHRELQKLKLLFPHHHQDNACKGSKCHRRSSLTKHIPLFYDSPPAHDLQVPDSYKLVDLDSQSIQNVQHRCSNQTDDNPIIANEWTDKCRITKSSNDLQANSQIISTNLTQQQQHIQLSRIQSVPNLSCNTSNHGQTVNITELNLEVMKYSNQSTTNVNRHHSLNNKIMCNGHGISGLENELGLNAHTTQTRLSLQPRHELDNSILLQGQMFHRLSNQPGFNNDYRPPSISQTQYNDRRCLKTTGNSTSIVTLPNTTSSSSNLTSNVEWNRKFKDFSNEDLNKERFKDVKTSYSKAREENMCMLDNLEPIDCQCMVPSKREENTGLEPPQELNESGHNNYYMTSALLTPSGTFRDCTSSVNTPHLLSSTLLSATLNCQNDNTVSSSKKSSSSASSQRAHGKRWFKATNLSQKLGQRFCLNPIIVTLIMFMITIATCDPVCKSIDIKYYSNFEKLRGCKVIEGNLVIAIIEDLSKCENPPNVNEEDRNASINACNEAKLVRQMLSVGNLTFPELREVTDFVALYNTKHITTLSTLFPNLTVIRGNRLIKNFALIIYQMPDMKEVGLIGLTHILNGGVRIQYNPFLCYVRDRYSINWGKIVKDEYQQITIEENNLMNQCPRICPNKCPNEGSSSKPQRYCWNEKHCQILETPCPKYTENEDSGLQSEQAVCYNRGEENGQLMMCSDECLGGCLRPKDSKVSDTQNECYACKHYLSPFTSEKFSTNGNHGCWTHCSEGYVSYEGWRCIETTKCAKKTYLVNTINQIDAHLNYKIHDNKCLKECPPGTQETEKPGGGKICVKCDDCPKQCASDGIISSAQDLEKLKGCTQIDDDLIISSLQLSGDVWKLLNDGLGKIKVIVGSLTISRSFPIVTLDFFEDLEEIKGLHIDDGSSNTRRKNYALELTENENLQELFPEASQRKNKKNVIIRSEKGESGNSERGSASIHYNPKLCRNEIDKLLSYSKLREPDPIDISYGTNGDKAICSSNTLNLTIEPYPDSAFLFIENYQDYLSKKEVDTRQLLKYEINYREISKKTFEDKSLSKHEKRDACGGSDWKIADHKPSGGTVTDEGMVWTDEQSLLRPLKPFTYYAAYVTTMIVKNVGETQDIDGAQSSIKYFRTLEYTPTQPAEITVDKINPHEVEIKWKEPKSPNGIIDHYEILMELRKIDENSIMQRPFCEDEYKISTKPDEKLDRHTDTDNQDDKKDNEETDGVCSCKNCPGEDTKPEADSTSSQKAKHNEENEFENDLLDVIWNPPAPSFEQADVIVNLPQERKKRSINSDSGNKVGHQIENQTTPAVTTKTKEDTLEDKLEQLKPGTRDVYTKFYRKVNSSVTMLKVNQLKHFGRYSLKIRACHKVDPSSKEKYQECSEYANQEVQTMPDTKADNIVGGIRRVGNENTRAEKATGKGKNKTIIDDVDQSRENKGEPVYITWDPPADPNLLIVNYEIKMIFDSKLEQFSESCETAKHFNATNNMYRLTHAGVYTVKVRAYSLYGAGEYSEGLSVSVAQTSSSYHYYVILIPVLVVVLIITVLASGFIYVKHKATDGPEITPNVIYHNIEDVYIVDDWEVERERVEDPVGGQDLKTKLGGGAFGVVYSGIYDCPSRGKINVAIKTVKDNQQCRTFLGEAQVMKNFKTPHVVQLIGVVSQGTPPLVLLEMMQNGSLKEYLHSLRASKKQEERRPTEEEYLQMALEIADGMAYLSTNKEPNPIVHCDLAARNCLVSDPPVIKIGDFGMAHEVYADYYKKGNPGMMPVRWMAPETLRDGKFSSASDVWSFGVVLWEMVTLAEQPYQGMGNDGAMKYIKNGGTMERPNACPDSINNLMRICWRQLPEDRPTFIDICQQLLPHSNQRFQRDSFITSNDGRLAIVEQQQSRDTQFNIMQDDSINERTQLTNVNTSTSTYNPSSFTDSSQVSTGNGNGNSNGNAGGGRITDNGLPPIMGLQMHNLSSPVSTNDENTTNGNHNEIIPTTSMHSDINISLVGNDNRNVSFISNTNVGLNRTILNRIRRGVRYFRSGRGHNHNSGDDTPTPKA